MMQRYKEALGNLPTPSLKVAQALRQAFKEGYTGADLRADLAAGAVVALVAVPLAMALAIASGVAPQYGLYTAIFGGGAAALLGGSRYQVTGPTAAFVVILAPIALKFGVSGLLMATALAGIMLILMGIARFGKFIQFVPHPVTTGFTAGIAVVIATMQFKDFLGLKTGPLPDGFVEKVGVILRSLGTAAPWEFAVGITTLSLLILWPRVSRRIPAPLVALTAVTVGTLILRRWVPGARVETIASRFGSIPRSIPHFAFPWQLRDQNPIDFSLSWTSLRLLMPSAFTIATLGAIESLLSATVADGMRGTKHDPDGELIAQGAANLVSPFFGGIAATGAIARTATNVRFGARSPVAAFSHSVFVLLVIFLFAPYVSYLPMAALAALLLLVSYNMCEMKHFTHIIRVAPLSDVMVLVTCFGLTVLFDMVTGVTVGVVLAAFLFMKRMARLTSMKMMEGKEHPLLKTSVPREIVVYEIAGPLFFGAAETAVDAIDRITDHIRTVIFSMKDVPVMDVTGLVAFESAISKLKAHKRNVYLVGLPPEVFEFLKRAKVLGKGGYVKSHRTLQGALDEAQHELLQHKSGG